MAMPRTEKVQRFQGHKTPFQPTGTVGRRRGIHPKAPPEAIREFLNSR